MKNFAAILLMAVVGWAVTPACAETILIDFGYNGQTTDPNGSERWNDKAWAGRYDVPGPSTTTPLIDNLIDEQGNNTDIDLFYSATSGSSLILTGSAIDQTAATTTGYPITATRDGLMISGSTATFRLENLDTDLTYDLTFFSAVKSGATARNDTNFKVDASTESLATVGNTGDMAVFAGVAPNSGGVIEFSFDALVGSDSKWAHWNTLEISAVPEPSTLVLCLGLGGMLLLWWRRRRM